jgi:hypothetical protein
MVGLQLLHHDAEKWRIYASPSKLSEEYVSPSSAYKEKTGTESRVSPSSPPRQPGEKTIRIINNESKHALPFIPKPITDSLLIVCYSSDYVTLIMEEIEEQLCVNGC